MEETSITLSSDDDFGMFQANLQPNALFISESFTTCDLSSDPIYQIFLKEDGLTFSPTVTSVIKEESNADVKINLKLGFYHNCRAFGCGEEYCPFCKQNPVRRCRQDFCNKYLVSDVLKANCKGNICVGIYDGGNRIENYDTSNITFEMILLNGLKYKAQTAKKTILSYQDLVACIEKNDGNTSPILTSEWTSTPSGNVVRVFATGNKSSFCLPELRVMRSSESYLMSRKPPYVLAVVAWDSKTKTLIQGIEHVVSSEFVVATRRVKLAVKADIPMMSEDVSKIINIGKQTQDKLNNLGKYLIDCPWTHVPAHVESVKDFYDLVMMVDDDERLRKFLLVKLNLSLDKWKEARNHVLTAVSDDNRIRLWTKEEEGRQYGLAFLCKNAVIDFFTSHFTNYIYFEIKQHQKKILWDPHRIEYSQRSRIPSLIEEALEDWRKLHHPNWSFCLDDMEDSWIKQNIHDLNSNCNNNISICKSNSQDGDQYT
uniref:Uncharacterized protein n=1 Tax=Polytomella parva TaxID=51329 RepID=A0A7S0VN52_9CHLO